MLYLAFLGDINYFRQKEKPNNKSKILRLTHLSMHTIIF